MGQKNKIRSLGVLCSGGDGPGMNNAIRSVVRTALGQGIKAFGIKRGFQGLIENEIHEMDASSVGNILQMGGTVLKTSRSEKFRSEEGRALAARNLEAAGVDALVIIGGNGSFKGAMAFTKEHGIPVVGVPGTIDNDISGTDYTIGFDSAVNTAVEAVDKIRDTANSHERTFLVEVMGRKAPNIAVHVGVCCGAENIIFAAESIDFERIATDVKRGMERGKASSIIIVAEGDKPGLSHFVQERLFTRFGLASHVCILGHVQRGGNPTHLDRFIGARMGHVAVEALLANDGPMATVFREGQVTSVPLDQCLEDKMDYEKPYLDLVRTLSI